MNDSDFENMELIFECSESDERIRLMVLGWEFWANYINWGFERERMCGRERLNERFFTVTDTSVFNFTYLLCKMGTFLCS